MDRNFIVFGASFWWILPILLVAFGLAYLQYSKKGLPWSQNQNRFLAGLRFLGIVFLLLLLLEPIIRKVHNEVERPVVVIGLDNSASISAIHSEQQLADLKQSLDEWKEQLEDDNDYRVEFMSISGQRDSIGFNEPLSDLNKFFKTVEDDYLGKNLSAIILTSDGIYNRGTSPAYRNFSYPVYTLGLGDTIPQRDVTISDVRHNKIAYAGNEFPVNVKIDQFGFPNQQVEVKISSGGKVLASEPAKLNDASNEFTFFLSETEAGLKHYTVSVTESAGEMTFANNRHELYIDILESKKRVRMAAAAPHPDMRAIRSALESTGNYEVVLDIVGLGKPNDNPRFDVQILFDGIAPISGKSGVWIVNGSTTGADLGPSSFLRITPKGKPDEVLPAYNRSFSKFVLNREPERMKRYSPVSVPFGDYQLSGPFEILLYQQVGSVVTDKPLLAVMDDGGRRQAVSVGSGIWQWRLQESASYDDDLLFSELVQKLVQFLSINENKKQFRVTKGMDVFTDGDVIFFDVEIYDEIFQFVEGQPYSLKIRAEDQSQQQFDFVFGSSNKVAKTTSFPPGTYRFEATTQIGEKVLRASGEFLVNALQLEQRNLTADHRLLKQISSKSDGTYYALENLENLKKALADTSFQGIIRSETKSEPLMNQFWVLLLIAAFFSAEWVLRRYWGAY
jgi:hypothetical protein